MAGRRCPSENGWLTWDAINWEKGGLTVLAKKTEHHGGDHAVRIVPICPGLRVILAEACERAEPGSTLVVPSAARATVNLQTHLERIITKAGHTPWPRLLQNLRASCATDWVERYPAHVIAPWLGHSPKVAAQHYLMSREHHFEHVVNGGAAAAATSAETPAWRAGAKKPAGAMDGPAGVKWRGQGANNHRVARKIWRSRPAATHDATHFRLIASSYWPTRSFSWHAWRSRSRCGRLCSRG